MYEAKAAYTDGAVASKGTYTFTAEFSEAHTNAVIKAYVFESLANIKPLVPLVTDFSASYTDSSENASLSVAQSVNGADKYVAVLSVANAEAGETGVLEVKDGSGALIASNHA